MALKKFLDATRPAPAGDGDRSGALQGQPVQALTEGRSRDGRNNHLPPW